MINKIRKKNIKLQSTVEYLITHAWAFVIIGIALVALYVLGVFTPNITQQCILGGNLVCENYLMNTNGVISVSILNSGSNPINVTGVACYNNQSDINYQQPDTPSGQMYLPTGSEEAFTLQCYNNAQTYSSYVGGYFSGSLSVNYVNILTGISGLSSGSITIKPTATSNIFVGQYGVIFSDSIQIENQQSSPVQTGFQQMFSINPSSFAQNSLNANLSNLEFTTGPNGSGVPIQAWIESGASNTATSSIIWLNLPTGITGNGGTESVYMNFLSNNNPVTQGYTGYAPQLWCASGCFQTGYAQYDDGASVFTKYWNFEGTSTPSGWTTSASGMINNELILNNNNYAETISTNYGQNPNQILDFFAQVSYYGYCDNWATDGFGYMTPSSTPLNAVNWADEPCAGNHGLGPSVSNPNGGTSTGTAINTGNYLFSVYWASNTLYNYKYNYVTDSANFNPSSFPSSTTSIGGRLSPNANALIINYVRLRTYPPNGVMPSVSCSIGSCTN